MMSRNTNAALLMAGLAALTEIGIGSALWLRSAAMTATTTTIAIATIIITIQPARNFRQRLENQRNSPTTQPAAGAHGLLSLATMAACQGVPMYTGLWREKPVIVS